MFEVPDAKRVRRQDLYTPPSSPEPSEPDAELSKLFQSQLAHAYGSALDNDPLINASQTTETLEHAKPIFDDDNAQEEGFEFRLFATSNTPKPSRNTTTKANGSPTTRIILEHDPSGDLDGQGGFTVPRRDPAYYFAPPATGVRKQAFESAALTGEDVQRCLGVRYTGWEVPWRVQVLSPSRSTGRSPSKTMPPTAPTQSSVSASASACAPAPLSAAPPSRVPSSIEISLPVRQKTNPNKKRRIILRTRKRVEEEANKKRAREKERKDEEMEEKGEAEREKRTRKNREKKMRKRARERAKKESTRFGSGIRTGTRVDGAEKNEGSDGEESDQ